MKDHRRSSHRRRLLVESLENRRVMAVYTVDTIVDSVDRDLTDGLAVDALGRISLRSAIMQSNANTSDDEIILPSGNYDLTLTGLGSIDDAEGDLDVQKLIGSLTIRGAGARTTAIVMRVADERVIAIDTSSTLILSGVSITGAVATGTEGGGILNEGDLELNQVNVFRNEAFLGGGLFHRGDALRISQSSFSINRASSGGGIYLDSGLGNVVIEHSTISSNETGGDGAGIFVDGRYEGNAILRFVTVAANRSPDTGGGVFNQPAIRGSGSLSIGNSIIAGNEAGVGPEVSGDIISLGNNVIGQVEPPSGFTDGVLNDRVGTSTLPVDAGLLPLSDTLGNGTLGHLLRPISPAIDRVLPASNALDQWGRGRSVDGNSDSVIASDSGALEFFGATIVGSVFLDADQDGLRDPQEVGISNWEVVLDVNGNRVRDPGEPSVRTDGQGSYRFDRLAAGQYVVLSTLQPFFNSTTPLERPVTLDEEELETVNFGNVRLAQLRGAVFNDLDADGNRAATELGLANVGVRLFRIIAGVETLVEPQTSGPGGSYTFQVPAGRYVVRREVPDESIGITTPAAPFDVQLNTFYELPGVPDPRVDWELQGIGLVRLESLALGQRDLIRLEGTIANDLDADKVRDANESGLEGWSVVLRRTKRLFAPDLLADTRRTLTDNLGQYHFYVWPGEYEIAEIVRTGFEPTFPKERFEVSNPTVIGVPNETARMSWTETADFNNDGIDDVVTLQDYPLSSSPTSKPGQVIILWSGGAQPHSRRTTIDLGNATRPQQVVVTDFNGDGRPDLIVSLLGTVKLPFEPDSAFGDVAFLRNLGNEQFQRVDHNMRPIAGNLPDGTTARDVDQQLGGNGPIHISTGDQNNDGTTDLLVITNQRPYNVPTNDRVSSGETLSVARRTNDGRFEKFLKIDLERDGLRSGAMSTALADFNGDGRLDIAVAMYYFGEVWVLPGNASGAFDGPRILTGFQRPVQVAGVDVNNDRRTDLVISDYQAHQVQIWSQRNGQLEHSRNLEVLDFPSFFAVRDFNGDGFQDLVIASASNKPVQAQYIANMNQSTFEPISIPLSVAGNPPSRPSRSVRQVSLGNLDGNAFPDLVVSYQFGGISLHANAFERNTDWVGRLASSDAVPLLGKTPIPSSKSPNDALVAGENSVEHFDNISINNFASTLVTRNFLNRNIGTATRAQLVQGEAKSSDLQNLRVPLDVDDDGQVTPSDALRVINRLNDRVANNTRVQFGWVDVDGDSQATPLDALLIINAINVYPTLSSSVKLADLLRSRIEVGDVRAALGEVAEWFRVRGASEQQLNRIVSVPIVVTDLTDRTLAEVRAGVLRVDATAAGWGWLIRPSRDSAGLSASENFVDSWAGQRIDLQSVIAHEVGHLLGLDDLLDPDDHDLMSPTIRPGMRRLDPSLVDHLLERLAIYDPQ